MSTRAKLIKRVPENLKELVTLSYNLWWSWNPDARDLFRLLDPPLWHSNHNPIFILRNTSDERLEQMAKSKSFVTLYQTVLKDFQTEIHKLADHLWWTRTSQTSDRNTIAYLSMEYGIHNSLPIYSGGLGILSGDHLKEASDLGIPIVAVGFLYQEGYFTQKISSARNGWQEEIFREYDFDDLPIEEVIDAKSNQPLLISVKFKDEIDVYTKVWRARIGRVSLYLLDSNIDENVPWYRDLTDRLYGGGSELRLQQELLLGVGAVRLFEKLGLNPQIYHLNEGHCSFSSLERIRRLMLGNNISFEAALKEVRVHTLFTTHTPVPAGHDVFPFWMIDTYLKNFIQDIGHEELYSLGTADLDQRIGFNMTVLGLKTSQHTNSVSKLHKEISTNMFQPLIQQIKEYYPEYTGIDSVTNGVHAPSFIAEIYQRMYRLVNENWLEYHDEPEFWETILDQHTISDYQIWEYHKTAKRRLFKVIRENARSNLKSGYWNMETALGNGLALDPDALTIGFARRFATYKRATLLFSDFQRLQKLIEDPYRPVQFIFAGKAHPMDDSGKALIQEIYNHAKNSKLGYRIAFLENYDLKTAKALLQGVDVWLNTPKRYNEASGTSGMKASMNFVPNLSILDGWWTEGFNGVNGWAINPENVQESNQAAQNWTDALSLYKTLEETVIPLYYDLEPNNIPFNWISVMREAARTSIPLFSSRRMLKEYVKKFYLPMLSKKEKKL